MTYETIFKECIEASFVKDYQDFMDEVKAQPEHVFSKRFEERMRKLMVVKKKRGVIRHFAQKTVAAAAIILATLTLMMSNEKSTEAGFWDVYFKEWFDEYFTMEQGSFMTEELVFSKDQITYLPEGFEYMDTLDGYAKTSIFFSDGESNLYIEIAIGVEEKWVDSEDIEENVGRSNKGKIYFYIENVELKESSVRWNLDEEHYGQVSGDIALNELVKVMDGIVGIGEK